MSSIRGVDMHLDTILQEIPQRYESVCQRVSRACERVGRDPEEITIVAVSKTFSLPFILKLYDCGHRHFGENKVQELNTKAAAVAEMAGLEDIVWHMIGHLQRNKARDVVEVTDLFHALDSSRLAKALNNRAEAAQKRLNCLVQINISAEESKFGVDYTGLSNLLEEAESYENLEIVGLMAMARQVDDPEAVRSDFSKLKEIADLKGKSFASKRSFDILSIGMSQDYEVAIEEGATHIRIGSAIFGPRHCMIE